jgi:selenocysteine lyase/cysteine desulfurase
MYLYNTFEEIDRFIEALSNLNIESALDIFF